jgi:type IV pilus assembly protein PilP
MQYCLVTLRSISILICLLPFIWGCGNGTETPQKPKVITQKIAVQKDAVSLTQKPKVITQKIVVQKDAVSLTQKPKKVIDKTVDKPLSEEPKVLPSEKPKESLLKKPEKPKTVLAEKSEEPTLKKPEQKLGQKVDTLFDVSKTVDDLADKKTIAVLSKTVDEKKSLEEKFVYNPIGKIDPFEPLVRAQPVPRAIKKKKSKRRIPRTPLEMVDLSQLRLTGIIRASSGNKAMVEEASGKGYVIAKDTYIGIHSGRVTQILNDRVIVEEEVENSLGNLTIQKRELKFQKPTGE